MGFSGVIDVIWLLIWGLFWNNEKYYPKGYWENTIHSFVLVLSIINLLIKVSLGVSVVTFLDCYFSSGPSPSQRRSRFFSKGS